MVAGPDFTNPAQVAGRTITYNGDNMPLSIVHDGAVSTEFVYDGAGKRAKKMVSGGATTYYIGDHYEVKNGVATKYIFAGSRRIAKRTGNQIYYYHKDHLGSSTVLEARLGGEVESTDYLPFGSQREQSGASVTDYRYTDQELDPSTGLYNYDARLYDPVIGRFISADSIIQNIYDPQALNRYAYCLNNPLIYIDPDGHVSLKEVGGIFWSNFKYAINPINLVKETYNEIKKPIQYVNENPAVAVVIVAIPAEVAVTIIAGPKGNPITSEEATVAPKSAGVQRAARFSENWKDVSLKDTVKRIAGDNPIIETSSTGKTVFRNPSTSAEVVHDTAGNYFRVRNSAGQYVDEFGKPIPNNVPLIKPDKITQTGVPKEVRQALTHFNNAD